MACTDLPSAVPDNSITQETPLETPHLHSPEGQTRPKRKGAWLLSQGGSVTSTQFCPLLKSTGQIQMLPEWTGSFQLSDGRVILAWLQGWPLSLGTPKPPLAHPLLSGSESERMFAFGQFYS